jgi:hypothetical protein
MCRCDLVDDLLFYNARKILKKNIKFSRGVNTVESIRGEIKYYLTKDDCGLSIGRKHPHVLFNMSLMSTRVYKNDLKSTMYCHWEHLIFIVILKIDGVNTRSDCISSQILGESIVGIISLFNIYCDRMVTHYWINMTSFNRYRLQGKSLYGIG